MKIFKQVTANNIELKPYPFRRELAMEAYLVENEEILTLDNENFTDVAVLDEEVSLKNGRKDRNGRIDILSSYGAEYLSIIELKLGQIDEEALKQLQDYLDQKDQISKNEKYWKDNSSPKWVGVLVGTSISADLQDKLTKGYKYNEVPIAGVVLNRFRSEDNNIFVISDTYFSFKYSAKDYSTFIFNGKEFNKGRLVNEVVREYVDRNPSLSFAQLKEKFPKSLQGSFGVFDKLSRAQEIYNTTGHKRHFIKPTEVINLVDGEIIATSNQWRVKSIKAFIENAKKLGFDIKQKKQ